VFVFVFVFVATLVFPPWSSIPLLLPVFSPLLGSNDVVYADVDAYSGSSFW